MQCFSANSPKPDLPCDVALVLGCVGLGTDADWQVRIEICSLDVVEIWEVADPGSGL